MLLKIYTKKINKNKNSNNHTKTLNKNKQKKTRKLLERRK